MLSHISVINFRNYNQCRVAFKPGINVLYGENGAGKTNLLEALSLLSPGRGLRSASLNDFIPFNYASDSSMSGWGITARIENDNSSSTISTGMNGETLQNFLNGEKAKRHIRIDNNEQSTQDILTNHLSVLWLTPAMDGLLSSSATEKRRFFDRIVFSFDPAHAGRLSRYERALRSRNQLLKDDKPNIPWIKSYNEELCKTGIAIAEGRIHTIDLINKTLELLDTPFPKSLIQPTGWVESLICKKTALEAEQIYKNTLESNIQSDINKQTTEIGIHKSDFEIIHCSKNTEAHFCSTGEQKAMLISIILSYAHCLKERRSNNTSLLLLDEMVAHIDTQKRFYLFDYLLQSELQVFATGTDKSLFNDVKNTALFLKTKEGIIHP